MARGKAKAQAETVTIYMVGASHGAAPGSRREVPAATAERLVRQGHAITQEEAEKRLDREIRST